MSRINEWNVDKTLLHVTSSSRKRDVIVRATRSLSVLWGFAHENGTVRMIQDVVTDAPENRPSNLPHPARSHDDDGGALFPRRRCDERARLLKVNHKLEGHLANITNLWVSGLASI